MGESKSKTPLNNISWIVWAHAQDAIDTMREPFLILDGKFQVLMANKSFYKLFRVTPKETEGKKIDTLAGGQWNIPQLRSALDESLANNRCVEDIELAYNFPDIGPRLFLMNARVIRRDNGLAPILLLAMEDVTPAQPHNDTPVKHQPAGLEARLEELERVNKAMVGRELKMVELKREIKELKKVH